MALCFRNNSHLQSLLRHLLYNKIAEIGYVIVISLIVSVRLEIDFIVISKNVSPKIKFFGV